MLPDNLKTILRDELLNDPARIGYSKYLEHPASLQSMLTTSRSKTKTIFNSITEPTEFLGVVEAQTDIENVQLVIYAINNMPLEGKMVLSSLTTHNSEPLLALLNDSGLEIFLNTLHIDNLFRGPDLPAFEKALWDVLEYSVYHGHDIKTAVQMKASEAPRISAIFAGIEGAPNTITVQDIKEALK